MAVDITGRYNVPDDYKSGLADVLKEAKNIYETKKDLGYQTYTGDRYSGFTPEELAGMSGISSLVGKGQTYFDPAENFYKGQADKFSDNMASYMNPYQQAVIDVEKREAGRDFDTGLQTIGMGAVGAGSFGGSRQGVVESEALRDYQTKLGDIQTKGSKAAFENAQKAFESQKAREKSAAAGLSSLGQVAPQQSLKEFTGMTSVGEAQRDMLDKGLGQNYADYQSQLNFPNTLLDRYQSTLYGYPYQSTEVADVYRKPSGMSNFMNLVGTGAKLYGMSQGMPFKTGGQVAFDSDGGLSAMLQAGSQANSVTNSASIFDNQKSNKNKLTNKEQLMQMLLGSYGDLSNTITESQKLQEEIANKQLARLDNTSGNMANFIGDTLINAAQVDPRAGTFSALAQGAAEATENLPNVEEEKYKIQQALLQGKISAAEAKAKLAGLNIKGYTDLAALGQGKLDAPILSALSKQIAAKNNVMFSDENGFTLINGQAVDEGTKDLMQQQLKEVLNFYNQSGNLNDTMNYLFNLGKVKKETPPPPIKGDNDLLDQLIKNKTT
tara:strand:+ start:7204 stop:8859 length:1656 start_codon:yes stop_codon:yes gene_type:complete